MDKIEYTPKRKWRIECTEEKLRLMASMVEDITRFIGGQPQLMDCLMVFDNGNDIGEYMRDRYSYNKMDECIAELCKLGADGWEIATCAGEDSFAAYLILKRETLHTT